MATRTISNAGGNWNSTSTWVENAVPTLSDDVVATPTSGHLTINVAATCNSLNFTNYVTACTHNAVTLTIASGLTIVSGMTYTPNASVSCITNFNGSGVTGCNIYTGGQHMAYTQFNGTDTWTLQDNWTNVGGITGNSAGSSITLNDGTLTANNVNVTLGKIIVSGNNLTLPTLNMGSGTWTTTGVGNMFCEGDPQGANINPGTSTLVIANT